MGPISSKQENSEMEHVNHPYFGDVPIILHENQQYMKIRMLVDSQRTLSLWDKARKTLEGIDPEPLLLPFSHQLEKQGMCGSASILNILYENHPIILKDEISNRKQEQHQYFEEKEVWYLLHILISSAAQFHKKEKKVGDIRPANIFINEGGQVKLANIFSWPREENNYFKSLNDKDLTYLAPEELTELQKNKITCDVDLIRAESFSIGLTLLDVVQLIDCSQLYNFRNYTFDFKKLETLLGKLQAEKNYSPFLRQIINQLLRVDPKARKTSQEIYDRIVPFEYNIKNLIDFHPPNTNPNQYYRPVEDFSTGSKVQYDSRNKPPPESYNYSSSIPRFQPSPYVATKNYTPNLNNISNQQTLSQHSSGYVPQLPKFEPPRHYVTSNVTSNYAVPKTINQIYSSPISSTTQGYPFEPMGPYSSTPVQVPVYTTPTAQYKSQAPGTDTIEKINYMSGGYRPVGSLQDAARNANSVIPPSIPSNGPGEASNRWQQIDKQIERSKLMFK